jgi:colicin import membrane protein
MQRTREPSDNLKAGFFSISVHALLVALLFFSFNWKTAPPTSVAEVTLWDQLPQAVVTPPPPEVFAKEEPVPPEPEPAPIIEEKQEELDNEIAMQKEREKKLAQEREEKAQKKAEEAAKKAKALEQKKILAALMNDMRDEPLSKKSNEKATNEALKKLQQDALAEEGAASDQQASAAAAKNASVMSEYQNKIRNKIRGNVNKTLCGNGNPELKFEIGLLPTGQLTGAPTLVKSSGNPTCDEAVERAIVASEPLPLPPDSSLFAQFRNLKLTFKPND